MNYSQVCKEKEREIESVGPGQEYEVPVGQGEVNKKTK